MSAAGPARLLLVDDDDSQRLTMAALLEDGGFVVVEAPHMAGAESCLSAERDLFAALLELLGRSHA